MTTGLVVAKAPIAGHAKTRLATTVGGQAAAELAAAALLDTIEACTTAFGADACALALSGDLAEAEEGERLLSRTEGWTVFAQEGRRFADRLEHAHESAFVLLGGPVVQVGMDTPQATAEDLRLLVARMQGHDAVLAPAHDGGWWALGVNHPSLLRGLGDVSMSSPDTGACTRRLLEANGALVAVGDLLCDVDDAADAARVSAEAPDTRFARRWAGTSPPAGTP